MENQSRSEIEDSEKTTNTNRFNPKTLVKVFVGLAVLIMLANFLYFTEKLIAIIIIFFLGSYQFEFDFWKNQVKSLKRFYRRIFNSIICLTLGFSVVLFFVYDTIIDRYFSLRKMTLYYATVGFHFYEEADVTTKQIGFMGFGTVSVDFVQDCCGGVLLKEDNKGDVSLKYYNGG